MRDLSGRIEQQFYFLAKTTHALARLRIRYTISSSKLIVPLVGKSQFGPSVSFRMHATQGLYRHRKFGHRLTMSVALEQPSPDTTPSPRPLVEIKALSARGRSGKGERLPLPQHGKEAKRLTKIAAEVEEANTFIASRHVEGCNTVALWRGYHQSLRYGGRWYATGDSYQGMPKAKRLSLRIDGEAVAEVDVRASHLTLLLGLFHDVPQVIEDPYGAFGFPREVIKVWVVTSLGAGFPMRQWPKSLAQPPEAAAGDVADAVLTRYPFLQDFPKLLGCSHDLRLCTPRLTNIEAEAMSAAMRHLRRDMGILALPMHDSLIVPRSAAEATSEALRQGYWDAASIYPAITVRTE